MQSRYQSAFFLLEEANILQIVEVDRNVPKALTLLPQASSKFPPNSFAASSPSSPISLFQEPCLDGAPCSNNPVFDGKTPLSRARTCSQGSGLAFCISFAVSAIINLDQSTGLSLMLLKALSTDLPSMHTDL